MRRLAPLAISITLLAAACATTSPKRSISDVDIDVPWEKGGPSQPTQRDPDTGEITESPSSLPGSDKPALHTTNYHLTWQGKRIGEAREVFHRSASGVRVIRHEAIRITRGGVPVDSETEIIIQADKNLHATRVELRAKAGAVTRQGQAIRADDGSWVVALDGEAVRKVAKSAVPLELVPYLVARNKKSEYQGKVLLAGYGFAVTEMKLNHNGRQGQVVLKTDWGDITSELQMAGDGSLTQADTGPTGSVRVDAKRIKERFRRAELPGLASIPVSGAGTVLVVDNALRQPPPALASQSVSLRKNGWSVQFDKSPVRVSKRIQDLVREVDTLLKDSHDAPGAGAEDAMALGRGDCTAHSTLLVDLASEQKLEAKLVTGFRIDKNRLVRHRWVTIKQGKTWVQVDPTFGEAPAASGKHLTLAIHGDSTAQIALVDEAVFRGLSGAKAKWVSGSTVKR